MHRPPILASLLLPVALCACGPETPSTGPTGSTCPPGSTLRYTGGGNGTTEPASFGSTFLATYCLNCHGPIPSGGAPPHASLDTLAGVVEHLQLIDEKAAAGPARVNTNMPPFGFTAPSVAERTQLGAWIACGAP